MSGILYDARLIKAYDALLAVCESIGATRQWNDALWEELLADGALLEEMIYYLEHHCLLGHARVAGYTLIDLFVWQMDRYNLAMDSGKNTESCNKEKMVLQAFYTMAQMKKDPEGYQRKLTEGFGMDK